MSTTDASVTVAAQILVSGIVQMVGYRAWTVRTAKELGVRGWVRNLHDSRVEAFAEGTQAQVSALVDACKRGPRSAQVTDVVRNERAPQGARDFMWIADAARPA